MPKIEPKLGPYFLMKPFFIAILAEYSNYSNVLSAKNTTKLPKYTKMNDHNIKLEKGK